MNAFRAFIRVYIPVFGGLTAGALLLFFALIIARCSLVRELPRCSSEFERFRVEVYSVFCPGRAPL